MDLSEKGGFGLDKRSEDHLSYHESSIPADWRFGIQQLGVLNPNASLPVCQGHQMGSSSSSTSMAGSFGGHRLWGTATSSQKSTFCDATVQTNPVMPLPRLDMGWNPSEAMSKGGTFSQSGAGILPLGLSQFPADSTFIERAARFSCFNGADIGSMVNPFSANGSSVPFSNAQKSEVNVGGASKEASMSFDNGSNLGSPLKNHRSHESSEHEFSVGGQAETPKSDNTAGELSVGFGARKRKRGNQEMELDQAEGDNRSVGNLKENAEGKRKEEQHNSTTSAAKPSGKHGKDSVDATKEDYVHVRARRGQATNSHSLAERVRREKISERMKFLQDLVPGCSKVTGKAVMLDEIINYVQSLQRQVEFLSMKLAAVNPRLDFNIERLLSKQILQSGGVSSTTIGFSPEMVHPQLHPAQHALGQSGIPGIGNPSDALRRAINAQLSAINAYREPENQAQIPNVWDNELHNVVQMDFGGNCTLNMQDLHGLPPPGNMKAEP